MNFHPSPSCRIKKPGGFSLFEIVIALVILALLTGTIFGIVWKVGDAAEEIRVYDMRDEQISRFLGLIRQTIESLPSGATMEMVPPEETGTGFYEMTISGAPSAFHFGSKTVGNGDTIIGLRPQAEATYDAAFESDPDSPPLYEVAISQEDFAPTDSDGDGMVFGAGGDDNTFLQADEEGRYWLPVLNGVTEMNWRFWDEEQRDWIDTWEEDDRMPELLELSLNDRFRPAPIRVVFEVPSHLSNPQQQQQQQSQQGQQSGSTGGGSTASGGGGGGPPGGGDGRGGPPGGGGDRGGRPGFGPGGGDGPRPGFGPGGPGGPGGRPGFGPGGPGGGRPGFGPGGGGDGGGRGPGGGGVPGGGGGGPRGGGGSSTGGGGNSGGGGATGGGGSR